MDQANQDRNEFWQEQDQRVIDFENSLEYPNETLENVPVVTLSDESDLENIPAEGGCYWIWTDEPIRHSMHKNRTPPNFDGGEVIYNGLTKDSIKWRVKNHLFSHREEGWSGISVDIYMDDSTSHRKRAMLIDPGRKKVAYYENERVTDKEMLLQLNLSSQEREYIENTDRSVYYFRNGLSSSSKCNYL
jgi:hypothetical protein